jgi:hypothetical protein
VHNTSDVDYTSKAESVVDLFVDYRDTDVVLLHFHARRADGDGRQASALASLALPPRLHPHHVGHQRSAKIRTQKSSAQQICAILQMVVVEEWTSPLVQDIAFELPI